MDTEDWFVALAVAIFALPVFLVAGPGSTSFFGQAVGLLLVYGFIFGLGRYYRHQGFMWGCVAGLAFVALVSWSLFGGTELPGGAWSGGRLAAVILLAASLLLGFLANRARSL